MAVANESFTLKHDINTMFTSKLESFIKLLCDKYHMTPENILDDWRSFSGKKPITSPKSGSSINDLKEKCR